MERIKIAQIGLNRHSHAIPVFNSLKKQSDIFEIVGCALVEDEREKFSDLLGTFDGYPELTLDEILNDPEITAVTVETEEIHLTKYALLAARHGKHIHMEKPGGADLTEFERLIDTVRKNGRAFHIGYMYRYNPMVRRLMERIRAGKLGKIVSVEAQMNCIEPEDLAEWLAEVPGGMMFFLGCHLVDLILQIMGTPEKIVPLNGSTGRTAGKDFGMAALVYPTGTSFAKTCGSEYGGFARRQLVVTGTKETVVLEPLEMFRPTGQFTGQTVYCSSDWSDRGTTTESETYDRYDEMTASFAAMARGERKNPIGLDYELELYRTVLRCAGIL